MHCASKKKACDRSARRTPLILIFPISVFLLLTIITIAIKTRMSAPFFLNISVRFFRPSIQWKTNWISFGLHAHHISFRLFRVHFGSVFGSAFPSYTLLSGCYCRCYFARILEINQRKSRHDALVLMPFRCYCNEYKTSSATANSSSVGGGSKVEKWKKKHCQSFFCFTWEAFMPTFLSIRYIFMNDRREKYLHTYTHTGLIKHNAKNIISHQQTSSVFRVQRDAFTFTFTFTHYTCIASLISCILAKWLMNPNGNVQRGNANFALYNNERPNELDAISVESSWVEFSCFHIFYDFLWIEWRMYIQQLKTH